MAQIAKMESQVDIKSSAERFFQTYCFKQSLFPMMSPNMVKGMQLIQGDSKSSVGSVTKWTYVPSAGNTSSQIATVVTEGIDEKNKSITCRLTDGDIMKLYSNFKHIIQVTNAPEGSGASVKLALEYEKRNPDVPEPTTYIDLAAAFFKSIDAYLVNNP